MPKFKGRPFLDEIGNEIFNQAMSRNSNYNDWLYDLKQFLFFPMAGEDLLDRCLGVPVSPYPGKGLSPRKCLQTADISAAAGDAAAGDRDVSELTGSAVPASEGCSAHQDGISYPGSKVNK